MSQWSDPAIYMSRATAREFWKMLYGTDPDLTHDMLVGESQTEILFDDRMPLGTMRVEDHP
jgi:hypothetical protein